MFFSGLWVCSTCGKSYTRKHSHYIHTRYDCGFEGYACNVPGCPVRAKRLHDLKRHIALKHQSEFNEIISRM